MSRFRLAVAAVAAAVASFAGAAAQAAPAMWRVTSPTAEVYLFGTLHALQPTTHWRTPAYDEAYAKASAVWFEADVGAADAATVGLIVNRYGVDPERGLSEKLQAADLRALGDEADMARIEHLRPWAAALMLSMQPVLARGAKVEAGADMAVTRQARAGGKQIKVFETLEDQARLFAGLPEPAEIQYLADVIHQRHAPPRQISLKPTAMSMESAWMAGDLARLGPGLTAEIARENPSLYDALLKRRNLAWADKLTAEMGQTRGVELVNVGALHMVGPDGLPALLAARGFKVERVQ
ncbi:MAG: hypothetical protein JWR47_334 [Phenylobacterium sp.]|nr:hypothetical protein [Phenylobacterium sp.]